MVRLTFWVYLETRSVVATGVIGGAFSICSAVLGPSFATFVDRHRRHAATVLTTVASATCFAVATAVFLVSTPTTCCSSAARCSGSWSASPCSAQ